MPFESSTLLYNIYFGLKYVLNYFYQNRVNHHPLSDLGLQSAKRLQQSDLKKVILQFYFNTDFYNEHERFLVLRIVLFTNVI